MKTKIALPMVLLQTVLLSMSSGARCPFVTGQTVFCSVSPESVELYLTGSLSTQMPMADLWNQMESLQTASLSSTEVTAWQSVCIDLLQYTGNLPRMHAPTDMPQVSEGAMAREDYFRDLAVDVLFWLSSPSDDPGLVELVSDNAVQFRLRYSIWRRLVDDWGMTSLPEPEP